MVEAGGLRAPPLTLLSVIRVCVRWACERIGREDEKERTIRGDKEGWSGRTVKVLFRKSSENCVSKAAVTKKEKWKKKKKDWLVRLFFKVVNKQVVGTLL